MTTATTTLLTLDDSLRGLTASKHTAAYIAQTQKLRAAGSPVNMTLAVRNNKVVDYRFFDPRGLMSQAHDLITNANGDTRWQVAGSWEL